MIHLYLVRQLKIRKKTAQLQDIKRPALERDVWSIGKAVFDEAGGNQHNITEALGEGG